tara:strand:- start:124 stop:342 length:219 start_codon:yes stop_codon:yes gene_type:complete
MNSLEKPVEGLKSVIFATFGKKVQKKMVKSPTTGEINTFGAPPGPQRWFFQKPPKTPKIAKITKIDPPRPKT